MSDGKSDEFWSFDEVLRQLRLDDEQLRRLVSAGEIRAFRDGPRMSFKRSEVEALLDKGIPNEAPPHTTEVVLESGRSATPTPRRAPATASAASAPAAAGQGAAAPGPQGSTRLRAISNQRMHEFGGMAVHPPQSIVPLALLSGVIGAGLMCLAAYVFGWFGGSSEAPAAPPADAGRIAALAAKLNTKLDAGALEDLRRDIGAGLRTDLEAGLGERVQTEIASRIQAVGGEERDLMGYLEGELSKAIDTRLQALEGRLNAKGELRAKRAADQTANAAEQARSALEKRLQRAVAERRSVDVSKAQIERAVGTAVDTELAAIVRRAVRGEVDELVRADMDARIAKARRDFGGELKAASAEQARMRFEIQQTQQLVERVLGAAGEGSPAGRLAALTAQLAELEARLDAQGPADEPMGAAPALEPAPARAVSAPPPAAPDCVRVVRRRNCLPWPFGR